MLERIFRLAESGTSARTEILVGMLEPQSVEVPFTARMDQAVTGQSLHLGEELFGQRIESKPRGQAFRRNR